jgi:hypothetical protein
MKIHKYSLRVSGGVLEANHGFKFPQNRLYFEKEALLGYGFYENKKIDFFSMDDWAIEEGEKVISGKMKDATYFDVLDLPNNLANKVISSAKKIKSLEKNMEKDLMSVISLINKSKTL